MTTCRSTLWHGLLAVTLESSLLRVVVVPEKGGKIVSICSKPEEVELLASPMREYPQLSASSPFAMSDGGGFEECLPSVAAVTGQAEANIPDHGDLWSQAWLTKINGRAVDQQVDASSRTLRLKRRLRINDHSLLLDYELKNTGSVRQNYLYSSHPLFAVDEGDLITLPTDTHEVRVSSSTFESFPASNSVLPWPVSVGGRRLDVVGAKDGRSHVKLFRETVRSGWGGLYRCQKRIGVGILFSPSTLPHLGVWLCLGAWPGGELQQYCVGLEPTTSPCDSLAEANGRAQDATLEPGASRHWSLEIAVCYCDGADAFRAALNDRVLARTLCQ